MKSIITAMGNPTLNNELIKYAEYDVISEDFFYQDAVLDFIEVNNVETPGKKLSQGWPDP